MILLPRVLNILSNTLYVYTLYIFLIINDSLLLLRSFRVRNKSSANFLFLILSSSNFFVNLCFNIASLIVFTSFFFCLIPNIIINSFNLSNLSFIFFAVFLHLSKYFLIDISLVLFSTFSMIILIFFLNVDLFLIPFNLSKICFLYFLLR